MDSAVIRVEGIGKQYTIGRPEAYRTMRDAMVDIARLPLRIAARARGKSSKTQTFWALKDVSFTVDHGEVVGIIGRNGAGKSTLLKVLSQITEPTEGRARVRGRVASLLEVGTGFHPELTGRENIFLNGAVLGMRRQEITGKFDEIVEFSEIERFIDTPVKRYSSGMYLRLAFAVAAHLEPEILVVDEVLAVGDAIFQRKCLGKMSDVARSGRTVLFVSHNMAAVANLCSRAVLLRQGSVVADGPVTQVIDQHLLPTDLDVSAPYQLRREVLEEHHRDNQPLTIRDVQILGRDRQPLQELGTGDGLVVRLSYRAERRVQAPAFMVSVKDRYGGELARVSTMPISGYYLEMIEGDGVVDLEIEDLPLTGGSYTVTVGVARANVEWLCLLEDVVSLYVSARDVYGSGVAIDNTRGAIILRHHWDHWTGTEGGRNW